MIWIESRTRARLTAIRAGSNSLTFGTNAISAASGSARMNAVRSTSKRSIIFKEKNMWEQMALAVGDAGLAILSIAIFVAAVWYVAVNW